MAPGFTMTNREYGVYGKQSFVISLPMWAKYSGLKLTEVPFERLQIKLKEPDNKDHIDALLKDFRLGFSTY